MRVIQNQRYVKYKLLRITFLCFLFCSCVQNGKKERNYEWINVYSQNTPAYSVSMYTNIKQATFGECHVWVRYDFVSNEAKEEFKTNAAYTKELYEISKDFTKYRVLEWIEYDENGNVIHFSDVTTSWEYFIPEGAGEAVAETVQEILSNKKNE